ncbi:MAG: helix-turn-helix domain-containing protein [Oscillospiraceae bacterium]|jgi:transcriptional regulator with XRE-family HTH domain|nr:helix-turn-helix domain-containing protein [Oscillospiraceae bacterium]
MTNNISKLRKEHSLTQETLAKILGVHHTTVSLWERNATQPDKENVYRLADLFNVTPEYVLGTDHNRGAGTSPSGECAQGSVNPGDFSADGASEAREESIYNEWNARYQNTMPYELYRIMVAMQHMTAEDKKRLLRLVRTAFPAAFG